MRASTKGLLVSAFVLSLSGAAYAQGAAGPGVALVLAAPAVPREATALDTAGTRMGTPNGSGTTGSTSGASGSSKMGTTSGSSQKQMNKGEMDSAASGSGIKKPY